MRKGDKCYTRLRLSLYGKVDILCKISLGYTAFNKYKKALNNNILLKQRSLLYKGLVASVSMCKSSYGAAPKAALDK